MTEILESIWLSQTVSTQNRASKTRACLFIRKQFLSKSYSIWDVCFWKLCTQLRRAYQTYRKWWKSLLQYVVKEDVPKTFSFVYVYPIDDYCCRKSIFPSLRENFLSAWFSHFFRLKCRFFPQYTHSFFNQAPTCIIGQFVKAGFYDCKG